MGNAVAGLGGSVSSVCRRHGAARCSPLLRALHGSGLFGAWASFGFFVARVGLRPRSRTPGILEDVLTVASLPQRASDVGTPCTRFFSFPLNEFSRRGTKLSFSFSVRFTIMDAGQPPTRVQLWLPLFQDQACPVTPRRTFTLPGSASCAGLSHAPC